jgi:hypothetical protein
MSQQYVDMWKGLGLDIAAHDMLLSVLGQAYTDIFLSQKDRPAGMGYFDFVMSEVHGLRIKELMDAKAEGRKVVGSFCVFVPEELILAVDGISATRRRRNMSRATHVPSSNRSSASSWGMYVPTRRQATLSSARTPATARRNPMRNSPSSPRFTSWTSRR